MHGKYHDFAQMVRDWCAYNEITEQPADFGRRAWPAYLHAIRNASYYFAVDELITICMLHGVSVAVFKEISGNLFFVDGWFDGARPVVCSKITANSSKAVRTHFERLLLAEEWGQLPAESSCGRGNPKEQPKREECPDKGAAGEEDASTALPAHCATNLRKSWTE